jgi:alkylation response protein AidB-like acyl-CoA dehydrogenase
VGSLARTEAQTLIEKSVERFVEQRCGFAHRLARLSAEPPDYLSLWPEYAERGLLAAAFREEFGGASGRLDDVAVISHTLGPALALEPYVEVAVIAGYLLETLSGERRGEELAGLHSGEKLTVLADGRPGPAGAVAVRSTPTGHVLNGHIPVVGFASHAHELLVAADRDGDLALLRVEPSTPGATLHSYRLIDGRPAADIVFTDCTVPTEALFAESQTAQHAMNIAVRRGFVAYCAEALGIMESLLRRTREYLRTRVQFGVRIGSFQALQHRFADLYIAHEESLAVVAHCIAQLSEAGGGGEERTLLAARLVVTEAAKLIGHEAIQMHGGVGATLELPVSAMNSRLVVIRRALLGPENTRAKLAIFAGGTD